MPNNAASDQKIVLAALARVGIQVWNSGPKISSFTPQTEFTDNPDVEPYASLEYACGRSAFDRVRSAKQKSGIRAEMAESAPETHPGRNGLSRKQIQPRRGGYEDLRIVS